MDLQAIPEVIFALIQCFIHSFVSWFKWLFPSVVAKSIDGDVIVITGAGSGIGRLMALRLAKRGAKIVSLDVNAKGNEETVRMIKQAGGWATSYVCDLSQRDKIYETADKIKAEVGFVSMLVNNAGIVTGHYLMDAPDDKIDLTFKVNILAHFWTLKAFLPEMMAKKKGHIVNVASLAGHCGASKLVDYCSSKFAAVGLDDALREELNSLGHGKYINTTVICPYYIHTGMFDGVKSRIVPIQDPEVVADRAVEGILANSEEVIIPSWAWWLLLLKKLFPVRGSFYVSEAFGLNKAMDEFTGRQGSKKRN